MQFFVETSHKNYSTRTDLRFIGLISVVWRCMKQWSCMIFTHLPSTSMQRMMEPDPQGNLFAKIYSNLETFSHKLNAYVLPVDILRTALIRYSSAI